MAYREGCFLHAGGVILDGKGLLFAGHSGAGKSTMIKMLKERAKILCDDRIIIRRLSDGFRIYGTWSHGEVSDVSPSSAPMDCLIFLEKASENRIIKIETKRDVFIRLLSCLIQPLTTKEWWDKTLPLLDKIASEVPCYILKFDKTGKVIELLRDL